MARAKQDLARAEELAATLTPGFNIVVRSKGYPAWPAVVVDESDVPDTVKAVKPTKKIVVPVLFYNDNSFLWISPEDIQELTKEQALKYSQAKVKKTLKDAYAMAAEAPSSYSAIMAKIRGETSENSGDSSAMEVDELPVSTAVSRRARSAAERAAEQLQSKPRVSAGGSKKRSSSDPDSNSSVVPSKKSKTRGDSETAALVDGDEDDSEYVDQGTTENTEDSTNLESDFSNSQTDLANNQAARFDLCMSIRRTVQENLLVSELSGSAVKQVKEALSKLDNVPEIEIAVIRKAKLNRVIYAALSSPVLPSEIEHLLSSLYDTWSTKSEPVIRGIPEHLAPREETEEPEDYDVSVDASREPTAEPQLNSQVELKDKNLGDSDENVKTELSSNEQLTNEAAKTDLNGNTQQVIESNEKNEVSSVVE